MKNKLLIYSEHQKMILTDFRCANRASGVHKGQDDKLTADDILLIIERQDRKCFYCNCGLQPKYYQIDHFYPKSMGGKTIIQNLVATCRWCNTMKNALEGHAFIERCKNIVENNQLNKLLTNADVIR